MVRAKTVIPELEGKLILHAGPPIAFEDMPDPVQGAAIGAALFEGWANDEESARRVCAEEVRFAPNNDFRAVGAMGGILSGNLPVFVVENRTDGNRAYTTMHEGEGKVLRFGVYDESVGEHLTWMRDVLGAALSKALEAAPGRRAGRESDPGSGRRDGRRVPRPQHGRLEPRLPGARARSSSQVGLPQKDLESVSDFLAGNVNFFLTLAMASAKATLDAAATIQDGQHRHLPDPERTGVRHPRQRTSATAGSPAPRTKLDTLFFPGFTEDDACPDCGDSAILEAYGLGGPIAVAAPVGAADGRDRRRAGSRTPWPRARSRRRSWSASNPDMPIPNWNFRGVPVGIDIRKVVSTGIAPLITTAVMHKKAGIGMVGVGKVRASMPCFTAALEALSETRVPA